MRFSVVVPSYGRLGDPRAMRALIEAGEELGYEGAWFADHVALPDYATPYLAPPMFEPLTVCAWGAGFTTRLRFGVDVLVAAYRHPVVAGATIASTALLSDRRLIVGVGVGYMVGEFDAVDVDRDDRGGRTDETLALWRALFEQPAPVTIAGERFAVDNLHLVGVPVGGFTPGAVPVWVGGNVNAAFRRAARFGDGWHPLYPTPEVYARGRAAIESGRAAQHIDRAFTFSYSGAMGQILESPTAWATLRQRPSMATSGAQRPEFTYAPPAPKTAEGRPLLTGTPDQLAEDVATLAEAGVEHLLLRFWTTRSDLDTDGVIRQYEIFAEQVVPRFS